MRNKQQKDDCSFRWHRDAETLGWAEAGVREGAGEEERRRGKWRGQRRGVGGAKNNC